jgi:DNA-binding transcriptional regulator of glucitol operon
MDTTWILIIVIIGLIAAWWFWSKYGAIYSALSNNPGAVHAGQAVSRYYTDIMGLVGAYEAQDSTQGSFSSRLGSFFGALPT